VRLLRELAGVAGLVGRAQRADPARRLVAEQLDELGQQRAVRVALAQHGERIGIEVG
jgi:hypothetical protein